MQCQYCNKNCHKAGRQKNGAQKLFCRVCGKYQQDNYRNKAYEQKTDGMISELVGESAGIRGISRILKIAANTVVKRIERIAAKITKPPIPQDRPSFEVDELRTYIDRKENAYWLAYALDRTTRQVMDFVIGKWTKATLKTWSNKLP
jgi:insertion element IS1 protein InsB